MSSKYPIVGSKNNKQSNVDRTSHLVGIAGEADFIKWASQQKFHVYKGFDGHTPADYILDNGTNLLRTEVKRIEAVQHSHNNYYYVTATGLHHKDFDYLFVSTPLSCYWIPQQDCPDQTISIKVVGDDYQRNIKSPGKYDKYKVEVKP
jgi:hypothetical protein